MSDHLDAIVKGQAMLADAMNLSPRGAGNQGQGRPDLSAGVAERLLGVTGADEPDPGPDLGELARPFAEKWFELPETRERCVGAIRDFILSGTFREWYEGVRR